MRREATGALLAVAGLVAVPTVGQAQTAQTLISNWEQSGASTTRSIQAQPFTTGGQTGGYVVTSVAIQNGTTLENTTRLHIVPSASNGEPDLSDADKIIALSRPGVAQPNAAIEFSAPANTTLAVNTTYHVVVSGDAFDERPSHVGRISGFMDDSGGAAGWSIEDKRYWRNSGVTTWTLDETNNADSSRFRSPIPLHSDH